MRILQSTRLQPNSLRQCALPAQIPALLAVWTLATLYPVCACTQGGLDGPKSVTMLPSIVNHPGKASGVILVQTASHPLFTRVTSLHSVEDPVHRGSGTQRHLRIVGTAITSFQVEKLITLRRWWYAWKSFLHTSNRWTSCAVSVCSHCKIVAKSRRVVPTALLPPWPVNPVGNAKGAFTCAFSWRVLTKGL